MSETITPTTDERKGCTSASNAHADALCPGRFQAQRGLPEEDSEDAESGTRCHIAMTGEPVGLVGNEEELVELAKAEMRRTVEAWLNGRNVLSVLVEERLWHTLDSGLRHSGKPDYLLCADDTNGDMHVLILDFKFGRLAVQDPADNAQLRDLAVLADAGFGWELSSVTAQIIQPYAGRFEPVFYDYAALDQARLDLEKRVTASHAPNAPRIAGEAQCKYCRAKLRCPEFNKLVTQVLPPTPKAAAADVVKRAESILPAITNEKLTAVLDVLGLAEKWFALIRNEARRRLRDNPTCLPGWTLKDGITRQAITDVQTLWSRWETAYPGKHQEFIAAVKVVKGDLEDALRKVTGLKGKALKETLTTLINGTTTDTVTHPRLMRVGEEESD